MSLKSFKGPFEDTSTDSSLQALAAKLEGQHLNLFFVNTRIGKGGAQQPLLQSQTDFVAAGSLLIRTQPLVRTRPMPPIQRRSE